MLTYNEWLSTKDNEDVSWLIKEFKTLDLAYIDYTNTYKQEIKSFNK